VTRVRVAIGAVAGVTGGPATYAVELVHAIARLSLEDIELIVLTDRPDLFTEASGARIEVLPLGSSWRQPWWDNVAVPRVLRRVRAEVYHGAKNALPLIGMPAGIATVVTIHDLAVHAEPETFSTAQRLQLLLHLRHAAGRADRVICVSQHAAGDVAARLDVPPERITVVPHGVGAQFRPLADADRRREIRRAWGVGDGGHLVSYVGTIQPRKRIDVAVDAVGLLRERGLAVTLVVAGRRRPGHAPAWLEAPPAYVRVAGELPSSALADLLGASDAMVSPSTYEGFGLTFAEAMACGCPVVGIRATSVPEVVGEGGLLVERADPILVADAMGRLLEDASLRVEKARAARLRASAFSWRRAAEQTVEVYRAAQTP
jgi:glycosyltransferase involved in cell wall biosynthesis